MAEQVPAVCDVLDTIERRHWERLRRLLHSDVHRTTAVEEHLHGPDAVIAFLQTIRRRRRLRITSYATAADHSLDRHAGLRLSAIPTPAANL